MRLEGKTALITGAAGGLGEAMARRFAKEGAAVVVADVNDAAGQAVAASIGDAARYVHLDVTDEAQWKVAIGVCGGLNVLVNNAGITRMQDIENLTVDVFHSVMNVDVLGVLLGCKHGIAAMKDTGGSIINVASSLAKKPEPLAVVYASAKAAVCSLTKTVALHCAQKSYPVRCNAMLPGIFKTAMLEKGLSEMPNPETALAEVSAKQPIGRLGEPSEFASLATYLASDESEFMTGSELVLDGGNVMGGK